MSSTNFMSQDSPESDYAEQTNFELSEYFSFDEGPKDDHASTVAGSVQNLVYQANKAFETGETGSQLEAPSDSKQS